MEDGDCQYYCCGRCKGLFEGLDELATHKALKCDGNAAKSNCELFACTRKQHLSHILQSDHDKIEKHEIIARKRKGIVSTDEDETPVKKRAKESVVKSPADKKAKAKKAVQDGTTGFTAVLESPAAGRRSSGRVRNMPAKYKDFTHHLVIKEEPKDTEMRVLEPVLEPAPDQELTEIRAPESALEPENLEIRVLELAPEPGQESPRKQQTRNRALREREEPGEVQSNKETETQESAQEETIIIKIEGLNVTNENTELEQQASSEIEKDLSALYQFSAIESAPISEENRTESVTASRVQTRTRGKTQKRGRSKKGADTLIKQIFNGEGKVKKQTNFTKEQKDVLAQKYKQYYKPATKKNKTVDPEIVQSEKEEKDSQDVNNEKEDEDNQGAETAKSENGEKGSEDKEKEKENQTSKKKSAKKKKVTKKVNFPSEEEQTQWKYHCPLCDYATRFVAFFENHMTKAHDNGKLWTCDMCNYTHHNKGVMRLHRNAHIKPFMCEFCSHKFSSGIDLKKHRYTHTGETPYKCKECNWAGRQKKALQEHMRKHTGNKLKCPAIGCDFQTNYRWALEQHRRSKHEEGHRFQCSECPYATSDSGSFYKHRKFHQGVKDYRCGQCSYKGVTKTDVIKHMRIHTHEKLYFCDRCPYSSCHSSAFKSHMMSHLGIKAWQCKICGFSGTTRAKIVRHLESKHRSTDRSNAVNVPTKLQLNLDDYKVPHDPSQQPNIVYEVIEAVEGATDETGAVVLRTEYDANQMSVVTEVDPNEFQGLAGLAAASEAASAQETVTQIIVQTVDSEGNPIEDEQPQHIELTNLPPGRVLSLPGGVMSLPAGVMELPPGVGGDAGVTILQAGRWEEGDVQEEEVEAEETTVVEEAAEENVVETFIIEQPAT